MTIETQSDSVMHQFGLWISPGGILAAFLSAAHLLPIIAGTMAGFAAAGYYIFQIVISPDFRAWRQERREQKKLRRIEALQIRQAMLIGELKRLGVLSHVESSMHGLTESTQMVVDHPEPNPVKSNPSD